MKSLQAGVLFLLILVPLHSQGFFTTDPQGNAAFPDAVDLRTSLKSSLTASAWTARRLPSEIYTSETAGRTVRFQVQVQKEAFYLILTNENEEGYPLYSAGSYIIKRSVADGSFVQAKIFLKNDPGTFVRLSPLGDRSQLELYLYDTLAYRNIVLPLPFEELLFAPFARIVSLTANRVDWGLIFPGPPPLGSPIPSMISHLRERVKELPDMDDGAMDAEGRFVYIESGERSRAGGFNCSGFAKYVADGLYLPAEGRLMPVEPLKNKHPELRGSSWTERYEEERDPFFGLDWTRNIAGYLKGADPTELEANDLRDVPFLEYTEDVGYPVEELMSVLYYGAVAYPGDFYLASVNAEFGSDPPLRQHIHVVVLMPFLNQRGELRTAVFERNRETGVDSLRRRYPHEFIHLVRIQGDRDFRLPELSSFVP